MKINTDNRVIPIDQVKPNAWNPKQHWDETSEGKANFARIRKSMSRHGQVDPLLVRELKDGSFEIVNGQHRYYVALEQEWKEIEIKNLGKLSDVKAKALALATEDAKIPLDSILRSKMVKELLDFDPGTIEDLPYSEEEAEDMRKLLDFDWDAKQDVDDGDESEKEYKVIIPKDKLEAWKTLKDIKGCDSDTNLIVILIDEAS